MVVAGICVSLVTYLWVGLLLGVRPARFSRRRHGPAVRVWFWQAGVSIHPAGWLVISSFVGLGAGYLGAAISGSRALGVVVGVTAALAPFWHVSRRRARRMEEGARAWPDALRFLAASLRSGRTLPAALGDLSSEGPTALRSAFARFGPLSEVFGVRVSLEIIRDDLADPISDRVVEVLITALERGGALVPALLRDMAESTTEDIRTAEEIETNSLEQRLNARVVIIIPWAVLMVLTAKPGPFRDFYSSPAGTVVIAAAAILSAVGLVMLARFGRTPTEPRLVERRPST